MEKQCSYGSCGKENASALLSSPRTASSAKAILTQIKGHAGVWWLALGSTMYSGWEDLSELSVPV